MARVRCLLAAIRCGKGDIAGNLASHLRLPGGEPYIAQVFAAAGRVVGVQRKRHLGEGEEAYAAAADSVAFEHAGARFAIAICAEAGFDAPFDAAAGARLVLFPAAPGLHGRRTDEVSWRRGLSWWESCASSVPGG